MFFAQRLTMRRLSIVFIGLFVLAVGAVFIWEQVVRAPARKCETGGGWWDPVGRECGMPIYIPDITGRQPGETRQDASRRGAEEIIRLEDEVRAIETARNAERARQEAELRKAQGKD